MRNRLAEIGDVGGRHEGNAKREERRVRSDAQTAYRDAPTGVHGCHESVREGCEAVGESERDQGSKEADELVPVCVLAQRV